jgi:hypothetical protein
LANIQRQCRQRAAELEGQRAAELEGQRAAEHEASGALQQLPDAPGSIQSVFGVTEVSPPISDAERFAAAAQDMLANVRRFFDQEDLLSARTSWESEEKRAERNLRTDLGCWCG